MLNPDWQITNKKPERFAAGSGRNRPLAQEDIPYQPFLETEYTGIAVYFEVYNGLSAKSATYWFSDAETVRASPTDRY